MPDQRLEWTVAPSEVGVRLDTFLAAPARLQSRSKASAALERGKVFVNGVEAGIGESARPLGGDDRVALWMDRPGSARARARTGPVGDLVVAYESERLLVVNKPAGLLSVPLERNPGVPSVYDQLEARFRSHGKRRPFVVHRIDQDTSGLVLFAKDATAAGQLKAQFKRHEPERVYWAIVYGRPEPSPGTWRDYLVWDEKALIQKATHPADPRASEAVSAYRVLQPLGRASLIEVSLHTGRRNQVRIQARLRGHTLVGERRYVYGPEALRPIAFPRHALHAYRLSFRDPDDDHRIDVTAPPPSDFADLLARLKREQTASPRAFSPGEAS